MERYELDDFQARWTKAKQCVAVHMMMLFTVKETS